MKANRPIAFVVLAFIIGATISQGSFAFADDSATNPFRAIWQAIGELQTKTDSLQAQINDLKSLQNSSASSTALSGQEILVTKTSETSLSIDLSGGQAGQTLISLVAQNTGPESAVGVKLSTYYQMSLLQINHIDGAQCSDQARGIIECYLGTIEPGSEARITIDATPLQLGQQAIITADVSSITQDTNPGNNHAETVFMTSQSPVQIPQQPPQQQQPAATQEGQATVTTTTSQPVQNQTSSSSPPPAAEQQPIEESGGQQAVQNQTATQSQVPPAEEQQQPQNQTSGQQAQGSQSAGQGGEEQNNAPADQSATQQGSGESSGTASQGEQQQAGGSSAGGSAPQDNSAASSGSGESSGNSSPSDSSSSDTGSSSSDSAAQSSQQLSSPPSSSDSSSSSSTGSGDTGSSGASGGSSSSSGAGGGSSSDSSSSSGESGASSSAGGSSSGATG